MTNNNIDTLILESIKKHTNIVPNIFFREDSSNILVSFEKEIPDEETTLKIENALKEFGTPLPNNYREASFVSFMILR